MFPTIFLWNQIPVLVDFVPPDTIQFPAVLSPRVALSLLALHMAYTGLKMIYKLNIYFSPPVKDVLSGLRTSDQRGVSDQNHPLLLGHLLAEY